MVHLLKMMVGLMDTRKEMLELYVQWICWGPKRNYGIEFQMFERLHQISHFKFQISDVWTFQISNFRCLNVCIKFQIDCSRHFTFWMWIQPLKQNWNSPLVHVYFSIFIFCMFIFIFICFFCMFIEACLLHLGFIWTSPFWRHYNLKSCPSVGEGVWNLKIWP